MIHTTLALLALVLPLRDGHAWLNQAEEKLYRWPSPGVVIRFEAETNVLAPMIAMMKAEIAKKSDVDAKRFVAALERVKIHGSIDTGTGEMTAETDLAYKPADERTEKAIAEIKRRVATTVTGAFQGLPLNDPSLLNPGSKVTGCSESGDFVDVAIQGTRPGETMTIRLSRTTALPLSVETPAFTSSYLFEELTPRRFIPSRFDLAVRGQPERRAEFSYQKIGELYFPETVKVASGEQTAVIKFHSLVIEAHGP
jgi:hypothetical protein